MPARWPMIAALIFASQHLTAAGAQCFLCVMVLDAAHASLIAPATAGRSTAPVATTTITTTTVTTALVRPVVFV
jgi:hypothetical protein